MAEIAPFRGILYNPKHAAASDVLAPPYDVIDQAGRAALAAKHENNCVRLILPKDSDADIGINFATSAALLLRVTQDLAAHGRVLRARPGFRVADLKGEALMTLVGARISAVSPEGPAEAAGLKVGDVVVAIGDRRIRQASDVTAAVQLRRPGDTLVLDLLRDGTALTVKLALPN